MVESPRLQVVVAHPDDETFGCGSLLLHARAVGAVTGVCCATRGEAGEDARSGSDGRTLAEAREAELRAAADLLGVAHLDLLPFEDSAMAGPAGPRTLVGAPYDDVVTAVRASLRRFRPDVVVTLDASDGHRDHARIRDAALEAALLEGTPRAYLVCLPRSLMRRWVDHVRVERPDMEHLDADTAALGTPDEHITTVVDVRRHLARREHAMSLHASQVSPYDGLPADLRRAFLGSVHARRVLPPWEGGPQETDLLPGTPPRWWDVAEGRWAVARSS